jgi:8-oxo-dGTP pyrophosphatase MutT (NUDIX family)
MTPIERIESWRVKDTELVLNHRWAKVRRDTCILPNGSEVDDYYYWEGGDFAQVFALTSDSQVVLVRQYKHGVREIVLELPAGMMDADDANPLATAQRELLEETGFRSSEWQSLGTLNVSSAKSTTRAYPFLAQNARRECGARLDGNEAIEVSLCSMQELLDLIARREIRDSNSLAACLLALRALGRI